MSRTGEQQKGEQQKGEQQKGSGPRPSNAPTERNPARNAAMLGILILLLLASAGALYWMLAAAKDRLALEDYKGAGPALEQLEAEE